VHLQSGWSSAVAFVPGEPGEPGWRWFFFSSADPEGTAHLRVLSFPDALSEEVGLTCGAVRWSGWIDVAHFLGQMVPTTEAVPDGGGPEADEHSSATVLRPGDHVRRGLPVTAASHREQTTWMASPL
jgi:hypothetical protein